MNLREAAQQALEALDLLAKSEHPATNFTTKSGGRIYPHKVAVDAGAALRTALAEPETEAETYKRLYELRGKALERPCFHCGYKPKKIYPMEQRTEPVQNDTAMLRQALEALEFESSGYCGGEQTEKALTALRERLGEKT